jgi:enoyl-CoA hydratase/carnithine racemase
VAHRQKSANRDAPGFRGAEAAVDSAAQIHEEVYMTAHPDRLILTEFVDDNIVVITMNRPERRNAFDGAMARALETAIDDFELDSSARVAVLTGRGASFSAGQDLKSATVGDYGVGERRGGFGIMAKPPTKPIIAAVEGHALAGGLELCLACDLIVASDETTMGLPEAARALVAAGGGLFRLPKRIPYHIAMELALTGKAMPASYFQQFGLLNRVVAAGTVLDAAIELAREVAKSGPLAVVAAKQIVRHAFDWADDEAWGNQQQYIQPILNSDDTKEGLRAFAEKRAPVWTGR